MKRFLLASVLASFALPAAAADLFSSEPPPTVFVPLPPYNWTGFYAGGHVGWVWSRDNFSVTDTFTGATVGGGTNDATSFHGGGQIGYDMMFPSNFVIGARTSVSWGFGSSTTNTSASGATVASTSSSDDVGGDVNARLGYAIGDFLPYAIGGWAWSSGTSTRTQLVGTTGFATPGTVEIGERVQERLGRRRRTRISDVEQLDGVRRVSLRQLRLGQRRLSAGRTLHQFFAHRKFAGARRELQILAGDPGARACRSKRHPSNRLPGEGWLRRMRRRGAEREATA